MDRELVLAILVALFCGSALSAVGWIPTRSPLAASGRTLERQAWRDLWLPFGPAALLFAALCGWALVEPASAERVPNSLLWGAVPFAAILARAVSRAVRALITVPKDEPLVTIGLVRPRIRLAPQLAALLDERALAAALAHERAHVRHRDPLRLWIAQLGSDLLWPWPAAASRFRYWRRSLELARDEEARLNGIAGPDLAAAILVALRLSGGEARSSVASLGGDASFVQDRIARLMQPIATDPDTTKRTGLWLFALSLGVTSAIVLGSEFGEGVVRTLLAVV